jgi:hypothetical protein
MFDISLPINSFGNMAKSASEYLAKPENLQNIGLILNGAGSLGNIYGAYQQSQMAKKLLNLQMSGYNDDRKKQQDMQSAWDNAFLPLGGRL